MYIQESGNENILLKSLYKSEGNKQSKVFQDLVPVKQIENRPFLGESEIDKESFTATKRNCLVSFLSA